MPEKFAWLSIKQSNCEVVDWHLSNEFACLATVRFIRSVYPAAAVRSLLK